MEAQQQRSVRVLIVEDELISRRTLGTLLRSYGYVVELAESAERALELLREHDKDGPDVILVDVDLPGMSGLDLLRIISAEAPHAVPVLVTASDRERIRSATDRGIPYIRKPINVNRLLAVLDQSPHHG